MRDKSYRPSGLYSVSQKGDELKFAKASQWKEERILSKTRVIIQKERVTELIKGPPQSSESDFIRTVFTQKEKQTMRELVVQEVRNTIL